MLIASLCSSFATGMGVLFCIVPGLIVAAGLSLHQCLIVDQKLSAIEALKKSWEMTNGHKTGIVIFLLLAAVSLIAGTLACCLGALLVSGPMISVGAAYIYLKLKGEQPRLVGS